MSSRPNSNSLFFFFFFFTFLCGTLALSNAERDQKKYSEWLQELQQGTSDADGSDSDDVGASSEEGILAEFPMTVSSQETDSMDPYTSGATGWSAPTGSNNMEGATNAFMEDLDLIANKTAERLFQLIRSNPMVVENVKTNYVRRRRR
jgi:hypothetical protein